MRRSNISRLLALYATKRIDGEFCSLVCDDVEANAGSLEAPNRDRISTSSQGEFVVCPDDRVHTYTSRKCNRTCSAQIDEC